MITLTVQQCRNAVLGLAALADLPWPTRFAMRVAQLRFAVQAPVDRLDQVHQERLANLAERDELDAPVVIRTDQGLAYAMAPAVQLQAQREYEEACKASLDLDVAPLTLAEIPDRLRGAETTIPPAILVNLGPLVIP